MGCARQWGRDEDLHHCGGASGNNIGLHGNNRHIYNKNRNDQYDEETVCMTVMARFGTGGVIPQSYCGDWTKVGALCATDYKWVQQEQVEQGKIIPVIR